MTKFDAEAICSMMGNTPTLKVLGVSTFDFEDGAFPTMLDGLQSKNCKLDGLEIYNTRLEDDAVANLVNAMAKNDTITKLNLSVTKLQDSGASLIAEWLKENDTIEFVGLARNEFGPIGTTAITNAIRSHKSLKDLYLTGTPVGDEGASCIAQCLIENTALETVSFGNFGETGLKAFVEALPLMHRIKAPYFDGLSGFTHEIADGFVEGIHCNTNLESIRFHRDNEAVPEHAAAIVPQVEHLLKLNRAGRKIPKSTNVPSALWPRVLAKSSKGPDVLFFFLREKSTDIVPKTTMKPASVPVSRKRKRGEWL